MKLSFMTQRSDF